MNSLSRLLCWFGGSPVAMVAGFDACVRRKHTARGLIFLANFLFLCVVWCGIGMTYVGYFGLLCPGLLVPIILVGYGRLVAMQTHRLEGDLAIYNLDDTTAGSRHLAWAPRLVIALMLSNITTFLLLMELNQPLIQQAAANTARVTNQPLLDEYVARINANSSLLIDQHSRQVDEIRERLGARKRELVEATKNRDSAEQARVVAQREKNAEAGGWNRLGGKGPRHNAWAAEAKDQEAVATSYSNRVATLETVVSHLDAQLAEANEALAATKDTQSELLRHAPAAIEKDVRYAPPIRGLFYDATLFLNLYSDPALGAGLLIATLLLVPVLFAIELSDLIAIMISRCDLVAVGESLRTRVEIARLVATAENEIAGANAGSRNLRIVPSPGAERYAREQP